MQARIALLTAVLCLFLAADGFGGTVVIDFDTLPDGSALVAPVDLTTEYVAWGALFDPSSRVMKEQVTTHAISDPNILEAGNATTDGVTFDVRFVAPGNSAVAATVPWVEITQDHGANSGNNVLKAYDLSGALVKTLYFSQASTTFRIEWAGGIHRVFASGNDGLDDLKFITPMAVPLPAASLLALPLFAMVWLARRYRRRLC